MVDVVHHIKQIINIKAIGERTLIMSTEFFHTVAIAVFALISAVALKIIGWRAKKMGDAEREAMSRLQFKLGLLVIALLIPLVAAQRFADAMYGTALQALSSAALGITVAGIGTMLSIVAAYLPLSTVRWVEKAANNGFPRAMPALISGLVLALVGGFLKESGVPVADGIGFTGVAIALYGGFGLMLYKRPAQGYGE